MKSKILGFLFLSFVLLSAQGYSQKNQMTAGLNTSYFKDMRYLPHNIFNPECSYSRLSEGRHSFTYTLNAFYNDRVPNDKTTKGDPVSRLLFSNDFTFDYLLFKNFFVSAGPTIRYRFERIFDHQYGWEFHVKENNFIDLGVVMRTSYKINFSKKSFVVLKLNYRLYDNGPGPLSFGVAYGWKWKMKKK
jgi:hypothetical protein